MTNINGKLDQLAFYCSDDRQEELIRNIYGLDEVPIDDVVTSRCRVAFKHDDSIADAPEVINVGHLKFWYKLGMEFEILRYVSGPSWHDINPMNGHCPFVSHHGIHIDDMSEMPDLKPFGLKLVQENFTISHTSAYLTTPSSQGFGRKYHYRIYRLPDGQHLKLIKRIHLIA